MRGCGVFRGVCEWRCADAVVIRSRDKGFVECEGKELFLMDGELCGKRMRRGMSDVCLER